MDSAHRGGVADPYVSDDSFFTNSERTVAPAAPVDLTIDQWSPLTHKQILATGIWVGPSWVPNEDRRRLDAYRIRAAYLGNVARHFATATKAEQAERREYGDAQVLRDRVVSGILGDDLQIVIDGASPDLPDSPDLPPRPDPAADGADPVAARITAARLQRWDTQAAQIVDAWETAWAEQPRLAAWQQWWRNWWDVEQLTAKAVETEGDAVGLGDGVYMLAWSTRRQRPVVTSIDPGFYFPVLDSDGDEYPSKVHLAWEFEETAGGRKRTFIRRLTFELVALEQPVSYPYADQPSQLECVFTDATWTTDEARNNGLIDLNPQRATYAVNEDGDIADQLPLGIDFIPVIHIPNTPATRTHYGTAVLDVVAQVLDDISASDTDLQAASALAALPMIALAGGQLGDTVVAAGTVASLPSDGRMDVLDLSTALPELRNINTDLLDRMSVNSRVPGEILGRNTGGVDQLSGVSRLVKLGPFRQLIETLRLTRAPKYQLLLRFAARLAIVHQAQDLPDGVPPAAEVTFGSYLPADVAAVVTTVKDLLTAGAISKRTGLRLLVEAGVEVGDAEDELARIAAEDTAGAKDIADATGSEQLAADYLGLDIPDTATVPVAPSISIPSAGGTPGQSSV